MSHYEGDVASRASWVPREGPSLRAEEAKFRVAGFFRHGRTILPWPMGGGRTLASWAGHVGLSLVIVVVTMEIGLRLIGRVRLHLRAAAVEREAGSVSGTARILHVGESTTFGLGVKPEQAYPAVLATVLEEQRPSQGFVSFNRGVPGLTTTAMLRTLPEKLAWIRPNWVTIMAGANDYNERLNGLGDPDDSYLPGPLLRLVSDLRLYKLARLAFEIAQPGVEIQDGEILFYRHGGSKNILYEDPRDEEKVAGATATLEANLQRMIGLCRGAGARVILVGYIQSFEENRVLKRVADRAGIPYVSTFIDSDRRPPDLFVDDGWHPSAKGHRHIAEQIARFIEPLGAGAER